MSEALKERNRKFGNAHPSILLTIRRKAESYEYLLYFREDTENKRYETIDYGRLRLEHAQNVKSDFEHRRQ